MKKSTLPVDWGGTVPLGYKDVVAFAYSAYESDRYRWYGFIGSKIGAEEMN